MSFGEQLPIVFSALNTGFLQTLRLFLITLVGAPLGIIHVSISICFII